MFLIFNLWVYSLYILDLKDLLSESRYCPIVIFRYLRELVYIFLFIYFKTCVSI